MVIKNKPILGFLFNSNHLHGWSTYPSIGLIFGLIKGNQMVKKPLIRHLFLGGGMWGGVG